MVDAWNQTHQGGQRSRNDDPWRMQQHAELMQTHIRRKMFAPALMVVETK